MKLKIEIDDEQLDEIVRQDIKHMLSVFEADIAKVKKDKKGFVFHLDRKKDLAKLNEYRAAFEKVLEYYQPVRK